MTDEDKNTLSAIYENIDFKSSYDQSFDPRREKLKTEANEAAYSIEKMLSGTITYYKREKEKFFNNPDDMNSFESLQRLESYLRPILAQFSEFRD